MSEFKLKPSEPLSPKLYKDLYRLKGLLYEKIDPRKQAPISSRIPILGPSIITIKKIIRFLLNPLVNMVFLTQAHFNDKLVALITRIVENLQEDYENSCVDKNNINCLSISIKELQQENLLLKNRLNRLLETVEGKFADAKTLAIIKEEKLHLWDHMYFQFENRYRGFEAQIKERQELYIPLFKNVDNILDIGCGRGEFLSLLEKSGKNASGIDLNEDMIQTCQTNGLNAKKANAFDYLKNLDDESLGGIFAAHVVEHIGNERLREFVQLCSNKLKSGGTVIFETPNPNSIVVSSTSFYLDLTHINPIHPETIKFLLDNCGIPKSEIKYLSPFPIKKQLQKISATPNQEASKIVKQINQNIEHLNRILYGYQDYAVIGKKI